GSREQVRAAANVFRAEAETAASAFALRSAFPLPPTGAMTFYMVTTSGTRSTSTYQAAELEKADHPLHRLAASAQAVLTAIRTTVASPRSDHAFAPPGRVLSNERCVLPLIWLPLYVHHPPAWGRVARR